MTTETRVRVTTPTGSVFVIDAQTIKEAETSYPPSDGHQLEVVRGESRPRGFRVERVLEVAKPTPAALLIARRSR